MENDASFVAPEGVYTVIDDHKPPLSLSTYGGPAQYPSRVSTVIIHFPPQKQGGAPSFANLLGGGNRDAKREKPIGVAQTNKEREDGNSVSSSDTPDDQSASAQEHPPTTSTAHEPRSLFSHPQPSTGKRKHDAHPKHNMRTTSSSLITRVQTSEGLAKTLQSKQGDTTFLFYNISKTCFWVEAGSKAKDPLSRITFSTHPTCHDINLTTALPDHLDVIIGFASGDLVWLDPITSRYERLNKQGCITNSACTTVRWVPSSSNLFLVSHADGTIVVYDKVRDDGSAFSPQDPVARSFDGSSSEDGSSKEWDSTESIFVSLPPWHPSSNGSLSGSGKLDKEKQAKNPVSHWRVSRRSIVDFVFSPDVKYVGAISEDGCLRVIDTLAEQLVDCYSSYFGALTCVAWSQDGRFILTGGQDDLLTIFSPWEQRVVARCQGHSSFVSALAFDDLRCDGRTYRFGSVGEDNKLILWDFSSGALHRPKHQTHHARTSMSSMLSLSLRRDRSAPALPSAGIDGRPSRYHPAPSRNEVAIVQPVLVKNIEADILTGLGFLSRHILTSTKSGFIKLWIRPLALRPPRTKTHNRMIDADPLT